MKRRIAFCSIGLALGLTFASVRATAAHPLGNFTVNRYAGLSVQREAILIGYIIDMAEIPAYQEITQQIDRNHDRATDETENAAYREYQCSEFPKNLTLTLNNRPAPITLVATAMEFPPGAGGLLTLRLTCNYRAHLANLTAPENAVFRDANYSERLGWREIVVNGIGTTIRDANVPSASPSDRLRNYPNDLLANPLNQVEARFKFDFAVESSSETVANPNRAGGLDRTQDAFAALIMANDTSLPVILLSLALAMGLGALHAISPGHGKTIMAAYLVGTRGTLAQALVLGLTVTITHTAGVLALGLITLFASRYVLPENLYPWLSLSSGLLIIAMGILLAISRGRELKHQRDHHHAQAHDHAHFSALRHGDSITLTRLIALGLAGGLVPSASALILLLSAISLQRIPFGIVLIVAFGLGMAIVLVGIGMLLVRARHFLERGRAPARIMNLLPVLSAIVVIGAGVLVTLQALMQMGILRP